MPDEDRRFLRFDVSRRDVLEDRFHAAETGKIQRIVAIANNKIAAEGILEREGHGWKDHVGELRLFVHPDYQRKGLGMLMARELYNLAAAAKVEVVVVKMMRPQKSARKIFQRLGFHEEILIPDYVKDLKGEVQDLVMMRCDLKSLWQEMEDYLAHGDFRRAR
jgi:L-amino acid N-acyltransferase YncA